VSGLWAKSAVVSILELQVSKAQIEKVLLDFDPFVRKYFKNMVRVHTGIDPNSSSELDLDESIHFLKHIWGLCLKWGNQRMDYIERSIQQLSKLLKTFSSKEEIHDLNIFIKKLETHFKLKGPHILNETQTLRATKLLTNFTSVRIKTAALIMRFICLDSNFFDVNISTLIPPLDRVNYRMCVQLFGSNYTQSMLGKMSGTFNEGATKRFDKISKEILGKNKVLIDNLWFIGHFYHGGKSCKIREGTIIIEYPYLTDINLPEKCPFSIYGCNKI